jgi:hypothetical protein
MPATLETLPLEVSLMILLSLSSPRDVKSVIRASPIYLQIFKAN